jgi:hypothetical protein
MANDASHGESERAARSFVRGKQAARMIKTGVSGDKVRSYISAQGDRETEGRQINATIGKAAGYKSDVASFKHGGKVKKTGIYKLHKGERVVPAGKNEVESFRRNHLGHKN